MRPARRRVTALGAAALSLILPLGPCSTALADVHLAGLWAMPVAAEGAPAEWLGSYNWQDPRPGFGGFSGLEIDNGGLTGFVLSDRGYLIAITLTRDEDGLISGVSGGPSIALRTTTGAPVEHGNADSEALRRLPDGRLCASFENNARISCHSTPDAAAELLPRHPDFAELPHNSSLESLAADSLGRLYTIPEEPDATGKFRIYRFNGSDWDQPYSFLARDGYLATDADFGPDGRLYVLERKLGLTSGFLSRVRSFTLTDSAIIEEGTVVEPVFLRHGNLEGLSVWLDQNGELRLTMIADNAQMQVFRNEITEYRLTKLARKGVPG